MNEEGTYGGFSSVLEAPPTPQRRRVTSVDLREEFASAAATIKDQKWVKALAQRVARRGHEDGSDDVDEAMHSPADASSSSSSREGMHISSDDVSPALHLLDVGSPTTLHASVPPMQSALVPSASDDILATLDPRFFTKSFDASAYMLENLPSTREEIDQFLQTEISSVDVAKDIIVAKLADDVRANHEAFIQGMKQVQDVDLDLVRAQIHVKNARRLILTTKNDLIKASLEIVKTKRNRDRVGSIINLGTRIVWCFEEEERMNDALQRHAFTTAVGICLALRSELSIKEIQGVSILSKLSRRVQNFLPELRSQFDKLVRVSKSLRHVAERFDPLQYKELLQAYITLADHAENLGFEFSARHLSEVLSSIPAIIVRCIDELSRQHLTDLFGERASPKKRKASKSGSVFRQVNNASLSTPSMTHAIDKVLGAYQQLTEFMHTYYLLVQWHRDPFNPSNDDLTYLHRCGIDDDDDDDDEDEDNEADTDENNFRDSDERGVLSPGSGLHKSFMSPRRHRSSSMSSEPQSKRSPYSQVLCETGMTLLRYRKIVWETMQHNVAEVLEWLDTTYGFKLEHIVTLSQATLAFIEVGEEFTGSPSTKLRSMLRLKCEQYVASFQDDNLELLRMLVDTESWQRILSATSAVSSFSGMLHLVEKRSGYRFEESHSSSSGVTHPAPIHERNVFPSFPSDGNPFAEDNASRWFPFKHEQATVDNNRTDDGIDLVIVPSTVESNHELESPEASGPSESVLQMNEEFVLTSSSLSGFVRMAGVYLKMMHHLPHISWDVFLMLVKLFEFNLYTVFVSFVDPGHAQRLFHAQLPDCERWEVLRSSIARISQEYSSGEVILRTYIASERKPQLDREVVTLRRVTRLPVAMEQAGEMNSYAFAEQAVASASIVSQTLLLHALKPLVCARVADRYQPLMEEVFTRCQQSALQLRGFLYSSFANVALTSDPTLAIPSMVAQVKWGEITYLSDHHNDYVVHIVRKCGEIWGGMQIYSDGAIPVGARDDAWAALVQQVMDSMLAGVVSVSKSTSHGRALMTMDLLAIQNGLDLINHVSKQRVLRGYDYVNNFVKAFYLDENELLQWVRRNKSTYSKLALACLIRNGVGSGLAKKELRELVLQIDAILSEP